MSKKIVIFLGAICLAAIVYFVWQEAKPKRVIIDTQPGWLDIEHVCENEIKDKQYVAERLKEAPIYKTGMDFKEEEIYIENISIIKKNTSTDDPSDYEVSHSIDAYVYKHIKAVDNDGRVYELLQLW